MPAGTGKFGKGGIGGALLGNSTSSKSKSRSRTSWPNKRSIGKRNNG